MDEDVLKNELRKETLKSSISIFLGLIISPISILLTIWLTGAIASPEIKIIDSNVHPIYNDIKLKSSHLDYLKNDRYFISVVQKYLSYGSSIDITLAKLKLSTAKKLQDQKQLIMSQLISDLSDLKNNSNVFNNKDIDWRLLADIPALHVRKKHVRNGLNSKHPDKYIIREKEALEELIESHKNRISGIKELYIWLDKNTVANKKPDNYVISMAIMNTGAEAGAVLPSTKMNINATSYSITMTEDNLFQNFKPGKYFSIPPNSIKVIKATIDKDSHPENVILSEGEIVKVLIKTSDETFEHEVTYNKI